jgi:hypothetical protein
MKRWSISLNVIALMLVPVPLLADDCNCLTLDTALLAFYSWGNTPQWSEHSFTYIYDNYGKLIEYDDGMGTFVTRTLYRYDRMGIVYITHLDDVDSVTSINKQLTFSHGTLDSVLLTHLTDTGWVNQSLDILNYKCPGKLPLNKRRFSWADNRWKPEIDSLVDYDSSGRTVFIQRSIWNDSMNSFFVQYQLNTTFDSAGRKVEEIDKSYDLISSRFYRSTYFYDNQGRIVTEDHYRWNASDASWILDEKLISTYTVNAGIEIRMTIDSSVIGGEVWFVTVDTLGNNGKPRIRIYQEYTYGLPSTLKRFLYTYDCAGNILTGYQQVYSEDEWIFNGCNTYRYFYKVSDKKSGNIKRMQKKNNLEVVFTQGTLTLQGLEKNIRSVTIEIFDLMGCRVELHKSVNAKNGVCVLPQKISLPKKIYFVRIRDGNNRNMLWKGSVGFLAEQG